jgi:proteasome lid subunit RPN8/RPN11
VDSPQLAWRADALEHARREAPAEACGLVVDVDGALRYWPCRNLYAPLLDDFRIAPEDWCAAQDAGQLVALFHSHAGSALPSACDLGFAAALRLEWHIVGLAAGDWFVIPRS